MKIKITKVRDGVRIELTYSTSQAPFRKELDPEQVRQLIGIMEAALKAQAFTFELEVG